MTKPSKLPASVWVVFRPRINGKLMNVGYETTKLDAIDFACGYGATPWSVLYKRGWRVAKYELKGKPDA
jgi:hypothetical protein